MIIQDIKYKIFYDLSFLDTPYEIKIFVDNNENKIFNFTIANREYAYIINADEKKNCLGCVMIYHGTGKKDLTNGDLSTGTWDHIISDIQLNESW